MVEAADVDAAGGGAHRHTEEIGILRGAVLVVDEGPVHPRRPLRPVEVDLELEKLRRIYVPHVQPPVHRVDGHRRGDREPVAGPGEFDQRVGVGALQRYPEYPVVVLVLPRVKKADEKLPDIGARGTRHAAEGDETDEHGE